MNHGDKSPVGQGNDSARKFLASQAASASGSTPHDTRQTNNYKYLVADELQKLRNSSHHCSQRRADSLDDNDEEHEEIIKGLLYPGIEHSSDDDIDDFFEEEYQNAQAAVNHVASSVTSPSSADQHSDATDSQRSRHRLGNEFTDLVGEKLRR